MNRNNEIVSTAANLGGGRGAVHTRVCVQVKKTSYVCNSTKSECTVSCG